MIQEIDPPPHPRAGTASSVPEGKIRSGHQRPPVGNDPARIAELERENIRLQLLVAELLIKNQQLRRSESNPTGVTDPSSHSGSLA